jgi:predicted dinucleotide-binding enzyme
VTRLLVFGAGYLGRAVGQAAIAAGHAVTLAGRADAPDLSAATHLLSTVPPAEDGDPVLALIGAAIAGALFRVKLLEADGPAA